MFNVSFHVCFGPYIRKGEVVAESDSAANLKEVTVKNLRTYRNL
jgi:hypothetical protein